MTHQHFAVVDCIVVSDGIDNARLGIGVRTRFQIDGLFWKATYQCRKVECKWETASKLKGREMRVGVTVASAYTHLVAEL